MSLNITYFPTVNYRELEDLFYTTYGYEIDLLNGDLFFLEDYSNDCYKRFNLIVAEEPEGEYEENLLKIVKLLRNEGITEDEILIEISW